MQYAIYSEFLQISGDTGGVRRFPIPLERGSTLAAFFMDGLLIKTEWKCPYCGLAQAVRVEFVSQYGRVRQVMFCDVDEGGCDRMVVLESTLEVQTRVYTVDSQPTSHWIAGANYASQSSDLDNF